MSQQLSTPTGITTESTGQTVTLSFSKANYDLTKDKFNVKFINKGNVHDILEPTLTTAAAVQGSSIQIVYTFPIGKTTTSYNAEVQAELKTDATPATTSLWGKETYWIVGPTLTVKIGNTEFTLSQNSFAGGGNKIYQLPIPKGSSITITYEDLNKFVKTLPGGLSLPQTYPNGDKIGGSLDIYEFIIDATDKLLSLNISVKLDWTLISGLTINRLGLAVKRTNGSI